MATISSRYAPSSMVIAGLFLAFTITGASRFQSEPKTLPIPKVPTIAALRAQAPDDTAAARFFDVYGSEPLQPGAEVWRSDGLPAAPRADGVPGPPYADFMRDLVCSSAAVVIGESSLERVLLNRRETFLFSKYNVSVTRWIHPERGAGPPQIHMSVPGGEVEVGGVLTTARESVHPLPGQSYLFFLERIPAVPAYAQLRRPISRDTNWSAVVRDKHLPDVLAQRAVSFEQLVEDLATAGLACVRGK